MGLPLVVDIAIGLIFIYLILSLLASEIQEVITTIMQWRAKHLQESIRTLISGTIGEDSTLSKDQQQVLMQTREKGVVLAKYLYKHPLIKSLNYEKTGKTARLLHRFSHIFDRNPISGPSAIPADTFATSIMQTLKVDLIVREVNTAKVEAFRTRINEVVDKACAHIDHEPSISDSIKASLSEAKMNKVMGIIVDEFTHNQLTLNQAFNKMYGQLYHYVQAARENLPESTDREKLLKRKFLNELHQIREEIYLDQAQAVWLEHSQTSVSEVLQAYKVLLKRAAENPDSAIATKIAEIKADGQLLHAKIAEVIERSGNEEADEIWDVINNIPENLLDSMVAIAQQTQAKIEDIEEGLVEFRRGLENWFNNGMQRANGVYKRNSKGFAFILGLLIAIAANVDTFYIVNQLSQDSVLRGQLANQAATVNFEAGTPEDRAALEAQTGIEIEDLDLPIGWSTDNRSQQTLYRLGIRQSKEENYQQIDPETGKITITNIGQFTTLDRVWGWLKQSGGWLISGVAISMGAPFWFELLSKVVDIKNTGGAAKTARAKEEEVS